MLATFYSPLNARSNNRLIASEKDGFGSGCALIHASSFASSSGGMRRPRIGCLPVAGRPRGLLGLSSIDLPLFWVYPIISRRETPPPPLLILDGEEVEAQLRRANPQTSLEEEARDGSRPA